MARDIYKRTADIEFEEICQLVYALRSATDRQRDTRTQIFFLKQIFRLWE